jgi:flagellar biosynthesis anti-sigma factor FlgM
MRIDLNPLPQVASESAQRVAQNAATVSSEIAASAALAPDQAQLSSSHVQVQALAAQVALLPEIRQERVVALRQTLQNGLYRPNPQQTAESIFMHMIASAA